MWPTRLPTLVLFVIGLWYQNSVGAVPLTEEGHGEHWPQSEAKDSARIALSLHDQGEVPFAEDLKTPEDQTEKTKSHQTRSVPASHSGAPHEPSLEDDLFKDMDAKTLAAILLQALKVDEAKPEVEGQEEARRLSGGPFPSVGQGSPESAVYGKESKDLTENVKSRTVVGKMQRSPLPEDRMPESEDSEWTDEKDEGSLTPQNIEKLESMLQELEKYSVATKRERSNAAQRSLPKHSAVDQELKESEVLRDLDAFEELVRRKQKYSDYQESEEDGQGRMKYQEVGEEGPKSREEEKMSEIASDLLLQYLLKGEDSQEQESRQHSSRDQRKKEPAELTASASEEKRSEEEEDDDIDPQTIDRLIEISSKLHLPADDVIDIINDVEKKRKDSSERVESNRHGAPSRDRLKSSPSRPDLRESNFLPHHRAQKTRHRGDGEMSLQELLGADNALDYDGLPALSIPRRYRPQQNAYPNYIRPRTYQQRHRPYYYQPPPPVFRNDDYYDDQTRDNEEELENYIEKILLKHPEVFQ
uniref:neurosecretory protein VGF-like n=1 Tax=Pristiophorus japonicus TaxID=55135 RepID=UPI00398F00E8